MNQAEIEKKIAFFEQRIAANTGTKASYWIPQHQKWLEYYRKLLRISP